MSLETLGVLLSVIFIALELTAARCLYDAFLQRRLYGARLLAVFVAQGACVYVLSSYVLATNTPAKLLAMIGLHLAVLQLAYRGELWQKLFLAVFLQLLGQLTDSVSMFTARWATGYSFDQLLASPASTIPLMLGPKLLNILFAVLVRRARRRHAGAPLRWKDWVQTLLFPLCTLFTLLVFIQAGAQLPQLMGGIVACTFGLMAANLAVLFLLEQVERERLTQKQNELLAQQTKLTMEAATSLRDAYAGQRRLTHDFKNHLTVLRSLLRQGQAEKAAEYLETIDPGQGLAQLASGTGCPVVDAVLNQKCVQARAAGVGLELTVSELGGLPLRDADLVVLLANLLDNAIEAAGRCAPGARSVRLRLVREREQLVLAVRNTVAGPVRVEGGRIATTKADKEAHGFGLQNIQGVLGRYRAEHTMYYAEGWFYFTAIFDGLE